MEQRRTRDRVVLLLTALLCAICAYSLHSQTSSNTPLSPRDEQGTFRIAKGFKIEPVAAEPEVVDPVAMCFDEDGRLFVVEMRGYPNAGVGDGEPNLPGRVKLLEDRDGDGYFEKATVYVDNLRFPTGVCCWRGGVLIGNAPDLLYCKDTDGDGKADIRKVLYTGFGTKNIQQLLNGLQFHFDNWIHGCNGSNDSVVRAVEALDAPPMGLIGPMRPMSPIGSEAVQAPEKAKNEPVALRGRHFRFKPDIFGSLEPTSGGGQYGLASDDWGNWFTCTNSQHLRHIVLPDHYLRRNPHLAVPAVTHDIPDGVDEHTAAAKVFRISPFEPWRLDRTSRRVADPMGRKFAATELVPGGYITSATGLVVYRGWAFPSEYLGNVFVCDPANNLIHRDVLVPHGVTFKAARHDKDCEFLASTDLWFRPVFLCHGPDDALYVADFYREIIETPLSLPEDIQKRYNLNSRERGRIWRIAAESAKKGQKPALSKASNAELVKHLSSLNAWWRLTAQRLLIESEAKDEGTMDALTKLAQKGTDKARLHALYALQGLGADMEQPAGLALYSTNADLRVHGVRLLEPILAQPGTDRALWRHPHLHDLSPRYQFQLAFTLGSVKHKTMAPVHGSLIYLAHFDSIVDPWMQTAILSSAWPYAEELLHSFCFNERVPAEFVGRIAGLVAAKKDQKAIDRALDLLTVPSEKLDHNVAPFKTRRSTRQIVIFDGLAAELARQGNPLGKQPDRKWLGEWVEATARTAKQPEATVAYRLAALRLIGHLSIRPDVLKPFLGHEQPSEVQLAAVQALSGMNDREVAGTLLSHWPSYSPAVRREVQEALFARADRLPVLLDAVQKGTVLAAQIDLARREQLLKHPRKEIKERAAKLFAGQVSPDRKKVMEEYQNVLTLPGDAMRGRAVFKKNCATCHRLDNEGFEIGPDLLSALKTKTKETLLIDILDPSREVDPRYLNYVVNTKNEQVLTGLIASETATSLVLRRAENAQDTLLRADIDVIQSTAKSLMPEGLEKQMTPQEIADVIEYLGQVKQ